MSKNCFVTGVSRGLGKGIAELFLEKDYQLYSCSRGGESFHKNMQHAKCDLSQLESIDPALNSLLDKVDALDVVILNAGIIGQIKNMSATSVNELETIMTINVWSNIVILDYLLTAKITVKQIILMSSGAAVLGSKGWGGYALSKSSVNMLAKLYAHEFENTHITAIAPGLIQTDMMNYLCTEVDPEDFPAIKRLEAAKGTNAMQSPKQAAETIFRALPELLNYRSGSFVDLRQIFAPQEYQALMKNL